MGFWRWFFSCVKTLNARKRPPHAIPITNLKCTQNFLVQCKRVRQSYKLTSIAYL